MMKLYNHEGMRQCLFCCICMYSDSAMTCLYCQRPAVMYMDGSKHDVWANTKVFTSLLSFVDF
jgi:hypothetical protein